MLHFEDLMDRLEDSLLTEIDINALAREMQLSIYEFRRIFTFVTGMPLGEYIRKRRLSLAALELFGEKKSITEIAGKYGYDSPSSFSRAFREFHSLSPTEVMEGNGQFKLLTRISVEIAVSGCKEISYRICECEPFTVSGIRGTSSMSDTECCEDVWNAFYDAPAAAFLMESAEQFYAVYYNADDAVDCCIGIPGEDTSCPDTVHVPGGMWACFPMRGTADEVVNEFYGTVLNRFLSSVGYTRDTSLPNIEVYPADMSADEFPWEIRIPIKRREKK